MEEDKKKQTSTSTENGQKAQSSAQNSNSNGYQQKQSQSQQYSSQETQTVSVRSTTVASTSTSTTKSKAMDPKLAKLNQLVRIYKDKVAEYKKTNSTEIKLWKFFHDIEIYVLEQKRTDIMDAFFTLFVHDEDLYEEKLCLRMMFECRDKHVKNRVATFHQVNDSLRRYFAEKAATGKAHLFLSMRAVARTFEGFPEFVNWANNKASK